ncbi:hypothetical protein QQF64_008838 [Cirrhinus molitorella]|uniref:Uncharacterized protein n=1 Tax=Cirrhinus molitorella TaxID=172907 RepID=A0ABR3M9R0_9TELE
MSSWSYNPQKFQLYKTSQKNKPENLQANHKKLMNVKNGAKPCRKLHPPPAPHAFYMLQLRQRKTSETSLMHKYGERLLDRFTAVPG